MENVCGLWRGIAKKSGDMYFTSNLTPTKVEEMISILTKYKKEGCKCLILSNNYKKSDKHPDFNLYITPYEPRTETSSVQNDTTEESPTSDDIIDDEDIPF